MSEAQTHTLRVRSLSDPNEAGVVRLKAQSDAYNASLYPPESNHAESIAELLADQAAFLVGDVDGQVAACGAIKICNDDGNYGEVKSLFVDPQYRGQRLASQLMQALEDYAASRQINVIRLETGPVQPAAIRLYESLGYHHRGPFGKYREDPLSVFMEKVLTVK